MATGAVILNVSLYEPAGSWLGVLTHVKDPAEPAILQPVECQWLPVFMLAFTCAEIVAPDPTVMVFKPLIAVEFKLTESIILAANAGCADTKKALTIKSAAVNNKKLFLEDIIFIFFARAFTKLAFLLIFKLC